jgi:hypothetical protein
MRSPGRPLTRTLVLTVYSMADTQSRQRVGNPACSSTSNRNGQATESKALARSILSKTEGQRRACIHQQDS